ncbi:MAG: hypothetical protein OSB02_02900 [Rhodospirillaceae bacterium]|nr:hypothetical protein [Rhodospirillaceae bacterium]
MTTRQDAEFEAFEEAGVMGNLHYLKAFPLEGSQLLGEFLGHGKRECQWMSVSDTADAVDQPDFKDLVG